MRRRLERSARKPTTPNRRATRVRIVLQAADGCSNTEIARRLGLARNTVRQWRGRWIEGGLDALEDRSRSGRPPVYPDSTRAMVTALACSLPAERGLPLSRFSASELHEEAARLVKPCPAPSTIQAWLKDAAIKPWQIRSWVTPRAPDFYEKAAPVLDMYRGVWRGHRLGPGDVVVCADEKTGIQALRRIEATRPDGRGRMRVEHEYERKGVLGYQAALIVGTGRVVGQPVESNTRAAFEKLVDRVMSREPCKSARRVFWVLDNGSAHHPKTFPAWLRERYPNAVSVFLPVHASWLNQIEIYFGVLQRKALTPIDVASRQELAARIKGFEARHNRRARRYR